MFDKKSDSLISQNQFLQEEMKISSETVSGNGVSDKEQTIISSY